MLPKELSFDPRERIFFGEIDNGNIVKGIVYMKTKAENPKSPQKTTKFILEDVRKHLFPKTPKIESQMIYCVVKGLTKSHFLFDSTRNTH